METIRLVRWLCLFLFPVQLFAALTAPALVYSTYLRDSFTPNAIATDSAGNIYLAGSAVVDAADRQRTVLVVKLDPQATKYLYVRYLGGSVLESANAIAVDGAGNAYIAGVTASPDFPVTPGGDLGTAPTTTTDTRSFVIKLDPNGATVFSDLVGGSAASTAQAIAVTSTGQMVVSGTSNASGFPATPDAYSVPDTKNRPFLLELDPTGTKLVFSATGIGGSAIALDSKGYIYVAGSTNQLDYPTTAGAYQTTFPTALVCLFPCQISSQGPNQYVTKVDPSGSKLIYSTALSNGNTSNAGLAVDQAGDVYVTGFATEGYPYTVPAPALPQSPGPSDYFAVLPFLSKLDAAGRNLLFSVPVGGAGVQLDSSGAVYVGGRIGYGPGVTLGVTAKLPALASVPTACLPNALLIRNSVYVAQADAASGNILGTQFIGGANLNPSAVALAGSTFWIAAAASSSDVPFAGDFPSSDLQAYNLGAGAYLGAADFSQPQPPAGTPQIGCLVDAADFSPVGPATHLQLLTLFGNELGPAVGISATDNSTTSLGGVSVMFGSVPADLLYVSATQINFAVPLIGYPQTSAVMQVTVNGLNAQPRVVPLESGSPHLFINGSETYLDTLSNPNRYFIPFALNADGSVNAPSTPAPPGSTISVFVNGFVLNPGLQNALPEFSAAGGWIVTGVTQASPFVLQVDLQAPTVFCGVGTGSSPPPCSVNLPLMSSGTAIGPGEYLYISQ